MVIKVERETLIRSIAARLRTLNEQHESDMAAYEAKMERFRVSLVAQLLGAAEQVKRGSTKRVENVYSSQFTVKFRGDVPVKPSMNGEHCRLRGDLARLKLSTQPVLSLKANDKMLDYLDPKVCGR